MAVVVEDGLWCSELMVETACFVIRQKEIFGQKAGHGQLLERRSRGILTIDASQESYQFGEPLDVEAFHNVY